MFTVEIITPEARVFKGEAVQVIAPGVMGQFGILTAHAPLFCILQKGVVRIDHSNGARDFFDVVGGFCEVNKNVVIILADSAEKKPQ
ncbi:MAG: ATP synthase F1 subunit epsilon [Candidatus Raymondbacteria bacterium RifOxyA12_full_50_37]|uniref:ATP synthase F1 subunit epsilon n=1 Tax=Candidatus Raymondbacteria bacterium RIFOXYD12_FULL_49_13 TaxID=1817890 RepID=A0A1F7F5K1_UNCRA|nr:MAG: ATP synthase F1 subunit epsilon [Candidatus Raymondbacteria bacterium RifOxyA12_full_50_37]OGJ89240.1 MAG: ATP synthase F1 subunit epsilon [Candidatus Raymondbacteria bacterium RIFOXYA2_FULL_49_16]OGJ97406.1 MAG: ATP synthase F1 subunit epsilon [Candidatus Raymondbacteria bacterium RIFOXYC2_FULL_50_21]OGJ99876.1 MAG: ATP synthase F1 subunit epsilon [Candidatus Raymondbacteria bacterium RifOxyB12_full_50_8]OGK01921.1 MAG: ATP synthase F1 subunit epsilon [Candidatus Raymondbacteria bacter